MGFAGVVVSFKHSSDNWDNFEKIRFQALVTTSLTAMVGAILPEIISIAAENDSLVWRLANLGVGIMHLANFGAITYAAFRYKVKPELRGFKDIIDILIGPTLIIFHFIAALGYIPWLELLLVIGAVQQLYIGISNFLQFVSRKNSINCLYAPTSCILNFPGCVHVKTIRIFHSFGSLLLN